MCDIHPSAMTERDVTARISHTCYSCGQRIVSGETYHVTSGIWDGEPERYRQHLLCVTLERQLRDDDGCWEFGSLASAHDYDPPSPTFRRAWETVFQRAWHTEEDIMPHIDDDEARDLMEGTSTPPPPEHPPEPVEVPDPFERGPDVE